jgi:hypothetical protein
VLACVLPNAGSVLWCHSGTPIAIVRNDKLFDVRFYYTPATRSNRQHCAIIDLANWTDCLISGVSAESSLARQMSGELSEVSEPIAGRSSTFVDAWCRHYARLAIRRHRSIAKVAMGRRLAIRLFDKATARPSRPIRILRTHLTPSASSHMG